MKKETKFQCSVEKSNGCLWTTNELTEHVEIVIIVLVLLENTLGGIISTSWFRTMQTYSVTIISCENDASLI